MNEMKRKMQEAEAEIARFKAAKKQREVSEVVQRPQVQQRKEPVSKEEQTAEMRQIEYEANHGRRFEGATSLWKNRRKKRMRTQERCAA